MWDNELRYNSDANTPVGVTEYAYDLNGQLAQIKDANLNPTTYTYDGFDRLSRMTYADNSFSQYSYDKNSNVTQHQTPSNAPIDYVYDTLNRLTEKNYPQSPNLDVDYGYDVGSRLSSVISPQSSVGYTYDALNRITQAMNTLNATPYALAYEYDGAGNRTKVTYPHGAFFNYSYDALSRLSEVKDYANSRVALFNYDTLSRRTQLTYGNNTKADYQYDMANQLRQMSNYKVQNSQTSDIRHQTSDFGLGSVVWGLWSVPKAEAIEDVALPMGTFSYSAYHYDRVGNRIDLRSDNQLTRYNYNNIYELSQVTGAQGHNYQYDNVGNRLTADNVPYVPNNLNQYASVNSVPFSYDANGNLTDDGPNGYTYDAENRLLSALSPQHSASYGYDGLGRRISKTVDGSTTYFIYDGDRIIEERDSNNALLDSYVYGEGIDEILTMHRGPQKVYYHYDGLGSVTNLTDTSGNVVESYSYDVYGQPSQLSTIGNRYYFTGREYDEETVLYYYRARMYSPTLGRFMQRDPIGYYDSMNLFDYVGNNPINDIDPLGLFSLWDVSDVYFFGDSLSKFKDCQNFKTGLNLFLDSLGLLPVIPALGMFTRMGDLADLLKSGDKVKELHHLLPQSNKFKMFFENAGLDIEKYTKWLPKWQHRLKPEGIHTGSNNWNKVWDNFFIKNPDAGRNQIRDQLKRMMKEFGIGGRL